MASKRRLGAKGRVRITLNYGPPLPRRRATLSLRARPPTSLVVLVAASVVRGRVDIVPVTLDNASVPSIGRHAATGRVARLLSDGSSVGCGQGRKGGAENDCSGKCDLCHIRHLSYLLRLFAAGFDGECSSDDP